ncbi:MAG: biotin/lipoyl-containing protein, partial [Chthoniobacterales bacterium]
MPVVTMPKLSDTMLEGTLVKWRKKAGDSVEVGDILAEVETDKATMEMESFDEGKLTELYVEEGGVIKVGDKIALILADGESADTPVVPKATTSTKSAAPAAAAPVVKTPIAPKPSAPPVSTGRVKASPLA